MVFAHLEAGVYFLAVGTRTPTASYELEVRLLGVGCGNGAVEPGERCDDGDQDDGDGCSSACEIEELATVSSPGAIIPIDLTGGGFGVIRVEVPEDESMFVRTERAGTCVGTRIMVRPETGPALVDAYPDLDDGCTRVGPPEVATLAALEGGTYFVEVSQADPLNPITGQFDVIIELVDSVCGNGIVEWGVGEQCDDGNPVDGDGCSTQCEFDIIDTFSGQGEWTVTGTLSPRLDHDLYAIDLTNAPITELSVVSGTPGLGSCEDDLQILLETPDVMELGRGMDTVDDPCDVIDPSVQSFARLQPGRYVLVVRAQYPDVIIPTYEIRVTLQ